MKKNHWFWMVIGCVLPLLLIFLAPILGLGNRQFLFFFIVAMFAVHLLMPHGSHGHSRHTHHNHNTADDNAEEKPSTNSK